MRAFTRRFEIDHLTTSARIYYSLPNETMYSRLLSQNYRVHVILLIWNIHSPRIIQKFANWLPSTCLFANGLT